MIGPSLVYSAKILGVGFAIAFLGSILPQLTKLRKCAIRVLEECFLRSFTALVVMTPLWITSNSEPLWPWTIGLLVALLGIKPSALLVFAAQKGLTSLLDAIEPSDGGKRNAGPPRKSDDSALT